jgi:hypothetical protein
MSIAVNSTILLTPLPAVCGIGIPLEVDARRAADLGTSRTRKDDRLKIRRRTGTDFPDSGMNKEK